MTNAKKIAERVGWVLLTAFATYYHQDVLDWYRGDNAEDYIRVEKISIPDFKVGENPFIVYEREIKREFNGEYRAKVNSINNPTSNAAVCDGKGELKYTPRPLIQGMTMRLSEILNNTCYPLPGNFQLEITWTVRKPNESPASPGREYTKTSNVFSVLAR